MTTAYDELKKGAANQTLPRLESTAGRRGWDWRTYCAIAGLSGGISVALAGSVLTASAWFTGGGSSEIQTLGTILLLMTIPLLIIGAHCLDLTEQRKDEEKDFRFREKR